MYCSELNDKNAGEGTTTACRIYLRKKGITYLSMYNTKKGKSLIKAINRRVFLSRHVSTPVGVHEQLSSLTNYKIFQTTCLSNIN